MYLNNTHGDLILPNCIDWMNHVKNWNHPYHPICVHAESIRLAAILQIANMYRRRIHVCHVSSREEILIIKLAKESGMQDILTCEVAPHHLFLTNDYNCGVKPPLQSKDDQQALWDNIGF